MLLRVLIAIAALLWLDTARAGPVLDRMRDTGVMRCGVNDALAGFALLSAEGEWVGFQVDLCRALAAAVLGDARAFRAIGLFTDTRFAALQRNEADVVLANVTRTLSRSAIDGVSFTMTPMFYDGLGFLAHRSSRVSHLAEAEGRRLCVVRDTTAVSAIHDYVTRHGLTLHLQPHLTLDGAWSSFIGRQCDLIANDRGSLVLLRNTRASSDEDFVVLPDTISREPLVPLVPAGDEAWRRIVDAVINALILAEDRGVTRANAEMLAETAREGETRRLLGADPGIGAPLGLDDKWALRAIRAAGNYGEIFERNLGAQSPFHMDRGQNRLWSQGGLLYPMPFR